MSDSGDNDDVKERKKIERLEQNRISARESRKRKKTMIEELQRTVIGLSRENKDMNDRNESLRRELMDLGSKYPQVVPLHAIMGGSMNSNFAQQQPAVVQNQAPVPIQPAHNGNNEMNQQLSIQDQHQHQHQEQNQQQLMDQVHQQLEQAQHAHHTAMYLNAGSGNGGSMNIAFPMPVAPEAVSVQAKPTNVNPSLLFNNNGVSVCENHLDNAQESRQFNEGEELV